MTNEVWGHQNLDKLQSAAQTKNEIIVDIQARVVELGLKNQRNRPNMYIKLVPLMLHNSQRDEIW